MEIELKNEVISPQKACEILETAKKSGFINRRIIQKNVLKMAEEMKNGRWLETGDTIKFDTNGILIDGQNRLNALIVANKTIEFHCAYNVKRDAVKVIDTGIKRSVNQQIDMCGYKTQKGTGTVVKYKLLLDRHSISFGDSQQNMGFTTQGMIDEYIKNPSIYDDAIILAHEYVNNIPIKNKPMKYTEVAAIYVYLVYTALWDNETVDSFFKKLSNGYGDKNSIYAATLNDLSNPNIKRNQRIPLYIKCFNSFINKREKKRFTELDWFEQPKNKNKHIMLSKNCIGIGITSDDLEITNKVDELELIEAESKIF